MYIDRERINDSDIEKWEIMAVLLIANDAPQEMIDEKLQRIEELRREQDTDNASA